jgi:predicted DNA-binding protein with PD1-like motif
VFAQLLDLFPCSKQPTACETGGEARRILVMRLIVAALVIVLATSAMAQTPALPDDGMISPLRPVPTGKAPAMQAKLVKDTPDEKVYAVVFHQGDEALSGLTDFAIEHHITDAHFTAIGATSGATLAWLDLSKKQYRRIPVTQQAEVLSLIGDIASFDDKPIVHMHAVLGKSDGSTVGGHVFELNINPTLEVFLTANATPLKKKVDGASGMKLIDPTQ